MAEEAYRKALNSIYDTLDYVLSFFDFCTGLVGASLNVFVVYALLIKRGISSAHGADMFVIGLTTSELMTGLALITSIVLVFIDTGRGFCIGQICLFQSTILCSALFVTLMTADRYFKIVYPFLYQRVCSGDVFPITICCTVFMSAFTIGFTPLTGLAVSQNISSHAWDVCNYLEIMDSKFRLFYLVLMFVPILVAVSFYTKIFLVARQHIHNIAKTQGGPKRIPRGRYMKMIFIMAGLYLLFYIPPVVTSCIHDFTDLLNRRSVQMKTVFHLTCTGIIINTIVNPIIYAYNLPVVKRGHTLWSEDSRSKKRKHRRSKDRQKRSSSEKSSSEVESILRKQKLKKALKQGKRSSAPSGGSHHTSDIQGSQWSRFLQPDGIYTTGQKRSGGKKHKERARSEGRVESKLSRKGSPQQQSQQHAAEREKPERSHHNTVIVLEDVLEYTEEGLKTSDAGLLSHVLEVSSAGQDRRSGDSCPASEDSGHRLFLPRRSLIGLGANSTSSHVHFNLSGEVKRQPSSSDGPAERTAEDGGFCTSSNRPDPDPHVQMSDLKEEKGKEEKEKDEANAKPDKTRRVSVRPVNPVSSDTSL